MTAPPHSLTPKEFGDEIEKATGVRYSKSHLYALLAVLNLTPKTPTMTHANRASRRSVMRWQRRVRKRIDRLRERGTPWWGWPSTRRSLCTTRAREKSTGRSWASACRSCAPAPTRWGPRTAAMRRTGGA